MRTSSFRILLFSLVLASCASQVTPQPSAGSSPEQQPMASDAAEFVAGELIVKFKEGAVAPQSLGDFEAAEELSGGEVLMRQSGVQSQSTQGNQDAARATLSALEELRQRADVEYAELNYILQITATPTDPLYPSLWGMNKMSMPTAWDITTGGNSPVIAVLDTGKTNHPDLAGRWVTGYDFITNSSTAKDGSGRDTDPTDVGDSGVCNGITYNNSWHGTHVAGTIGATANNGVGVAGVNWNARIAPLRVMGMCGGTTTDIVDAIRWAAGIKVTGLPTNPTPAKVINMSLGAYTGAACPSVYQNAINAAIAKGVTVVVAAGNNNKDTVGAIPGNCAGVITVGASASTDRRAWYSNYGSTVEISAPGGETGYDRNNDGQMDGIWSTLLDSTGSSYIYAAYQGTSMAAPHVAGVVSLMYAVKPKITPAQVGNLLQSTATPFPVGICTEGCGTGMVHAEKAIRAARGY